MDYELALISVVVAGGYWGWFFVRRRPHGTATFGLMCLGSAALAALGLLGRRYGGGLLGIAGAVGVGAGACLLVVGPLVRGLARWLAGRERFSFAQRLLDLADVLAPGSGVAEEKAMLGAMREIRDGRIEHAVDALVAAKSDAKSDAVLAIDERIAMLYLAAYRWDEAIAHAEQHLFGAVPEPDPQDGKVPLRRALGVAPPVWVELLGAYGRTGDLDRAASMLSRLEDVCVDRADAAVWVHRARLMFLALAGRPDAVRALVAPRHARHMSAAARTYWLAVAHEKHGDGTEAGVAYAKARGRARGRPRELIDLAIAKLSTVQPTELSPVATEVVARVEAAAPPVVVRQRTRGPIVTNTLTLVLLGVAAAISLVLGPSNDVGVLSRAGALVPTFVDAGEWWRLVTCIFIHIGGLHLLLNATGMYVLGRLAEEMFGRARTLAIFGCAGIGGACASFAASGASSAGASGAVFGVLGAVFVEISWHRARYQQAWKRGMWGGLAIVTLAQLGYGFAYPVVDQWAHGAGLGVGALLGLVLSPHARWARAGRYVAGALAGGFVAVALVAGAFAVSTSSGDSLARLPTARQVVGQVSVDAPTAWYLAGDEIRQTDVFIMLKLERQPGPLSGQIVSRLAAEPDRARAGGFDQIEAATEPLVPLPPGWEGRELETSVPDPLGGRQQYRIVVAGAAIGGEVVIASLYLPEAIARSAPAYFTKLLGSAR